MRISWGLRGVAAVAIASVPIAARAQSTPPFDPAIDVQTFEYAVGPKTFVTVADGDVAAHKQIAVDALVTFLTKPFQIYNVDENHAITGARTTVVSSMAAAQLTCAYGITDRLQLGGNLPIVFALTGDGLMPGTGAPAAGGLNVTGLGDLVVEGKYRLVRAGRLKASAIGGLSLPSSFGSGGSQFIGDDLPTVRGKLAAQFDSGRLSLGVNAGILLRKPRTIYDSTIGQQLIWGVAGAVQLTERVSVIAEGYGRAGLPSFALDASPLEVEGGVRIHATGSVAIVIGGGAGLINGIGSPESRLFLSLGYAPDMRDSDGDGIPNGRDRCPLVPEDKDGFEDDDGCPDDDNDGDHRPDATDQCPNQAEDIDGFEDDDGCPDLDNDKDGIPDLQDKCPNDREDGLPPNPRDGCPAGKRDSDGDGIPDALDACPLEEEDMDGFEDGDGCPDLDNDKDGIPDARDQCPLCPEDKDGFEDDDGCPDPDNDHDGIPDEVDRCPLVAETVNGVADDDGCPDSGGATVVTLDGDRLAIDRMPTLDGRNLSRAGQIVVDQLALVMRGHAEVNHWLIAIALPSASDAQRVGDAVKARLVTRGIPADGVDILTAAGSAKIGGLVRERAPVDAPPVCPAGREARPRPEATKPRTPAPPAAASPQAPPVQPAKP
ncbi:MAG TPA: thrombospondin type 3 repeat-containing protein [Kofleriaceae bacterium]|nr:thrombospondin type 3 repeat-containing protein [Kofleriaceae bacterium]